jgi:hypothetical protein
MFHSDQVTSQDRIDESTGAPMVWAQLPRPEKDRAVLENEAGYEMVCR